MTTFDIVIAVLLLFGFVRGLLKGLFVEVASLVALIAGVYGAIHFSYFIGDWLQDSVSWDEKYVSLAAFAGTFILIVIAISLLGKVLTKLANFAALGILNTILGGVFGTLKIGLIVSVVFIFFDKINSTIPFVEKEKLEESILYTPVKKIAPTIFPSIIKDIEKEKEEIL
ncbi:CvpA family protein [Tenacibaculum sp. SG-28]|uniref:CvpA family protein n=1 Tax=Tenacibaculum sp. SG-28 TaxID=754426 RepID=UPI000CF3CEAE|nr:CvpA family protein [Tenacibaculum sp. SG-28]PQJ21208.1 colicin V production protein [Tenacibaculum sp. SG-28]